MPSSGPEPGHRTPTRKSRKDALKTPAVTPSTHRHGLVRPNPINTSVQDRLHRARSVPTPPSSGIRVVVPGPQAPPTEVARRTQNHARVKKSAIVLKTNEKKAVLEAALYLARQHPRLDRRKSFFDGVKILLSSRFKFPENRLPERLDRVVHNWRHKRDQEVEHGNNADLRQNSTGFTLLLDQFCAVWAKYSPLRKSPLDKAQELASQLEARDPGGYGLPNESQEEEPAAEAPPAGNAANSINTNMARANSNVASDGLANESEEAAAAQLVASTAENTNAAVARIDLEAVPEEPRKLRKKGNKESRKRQRTREKRDERVAKNAERTRERTRNIAKRQRQLLDLMTALRFDFQSGLEQVHSRMRQVHEPQTNTIVPTLHTLQAQQRSSGPRMQHNMPTENNQRQQRSAVNDDSIPSLPQQQPMQQQKQRKRKRKPNTRKQQQQPS